MHSVEIGHGIAARVNVSGARAFTAVGGTDAFVTLDSLETALRADDFTAITAELTNIDAAREQIGQARSDAGLILNRLAVADAAAEKTSILLEGHQSEIGDADAVAALTELTATSSAIEQAIAVARTTLNTTIARF